MRTKNIILESLAPKRFCYLFGIIAMMSCSPFKEETKGVDTVTRKRTSYHPFKPYKYVKTKKIRKGVLIEYSYFKIRTNGTWEKTVESKTICYDSLSGKRLTLEHEKVYRKSSLKGYKFY